MSQHAISNSNAVSEPVLLREMRSDGVQWLTLNRPEARNSLSEELMGALQQALNEAEADSSVRCVVIAGAGKVFCSGHDLKQMTLHRDDGDGGRLYYQDLLNQCAHLMQTIVRLKKPVIARVHGVATAAGCQLVASCDLAVAAYDARFATPGVNIGLFCSTPMVALSRNVSRKHAMEMLLLGEMIDAERAAEFGLVNRIVPPAELDEAVMDMANVIASKSPLTLAIGKEAFYEQAEMTLANAYKYAGEVMVRNMMARDAEEGIAAFIEKREPKWEGR